MKSEGKKVSILFIATGCWNQKELFICFKVMVCLVLDAIKGIAAPCVCCTGNNLVVVYNYTWYSSVDTQIMISSHGKMRADQLNAALPFHARQRVKFSPFAYKRAQPYSFFIFLHGMYARSGGSNIIHTRTIGGNGNAR